MYHTTYIFILIVKLKPFNFYIYITFKETYKQMLLRKIYLFKKKNKNKNRNYGKHKLLVQNNKLWLIVWLLKQKLKLTQKKKEITHTDIILYIQKYIFYETKKRKKESY